MVLKDFVKNNKVIFMKKCILILPYFGHFNNYFNLFLKSVQFNSDFLDLLLVTDNSQKYDFPKNVIKVNLQFIDLKKMFDDRLELNVTLNSPYKLCDFKPSYGYVFNNYIKDYEYWGYCDCDMILGNFKKILSPIFLQGYEKIFAAGHLTLYKNNDLNNKFFMKNIDYVFPYQIAFSTDKIYVFDEDVYFIQKHNIHSIYKNYNKKIYDKDLSFNCSTNYLYLTRAVYDCSSRNFVDEKIPYRLFFNNGNLNGYCYNNNEFLKKEFLYCHLQMRKMKVKIKDDSKIFEIRADKFILQKEPRDYKEFLSYNPKRYGMAKMYILVRKLKKIIFHNEKKIEFY